MSIDWSQEIMGMMLIRLFPFWATLRRKIGMAATHVPNNLSRFWVNYIPQP